MQRTTVINDRYVTSRLLGAGGMAQVFLARDEILERDVAVKVLREQYAENEEFVELKLDSPFLRGDRVRTLQTALEAIGFEVGTIDGVFGRGTDQAVRAFQEWYGLPVTGVVDIDTANGIAAEYAAIFAPPQAPSGEPSDSTDEPQQQAEPSATDNEEQGENASGATQSTGDSNAT